MLEINEITVRPGDRLGISRALAVRNPDGTVPHVRCDGARFHVLSFDNLGQVCSEPLCVLNNDRRWLKEQVCR